MITTIEEITFDQYVGRRIKKRRHELDMTMDCVVDGCDISKGFLSEIENGHCTIGFRKLYYLAQVLGRSTDWFAKGWE